MARGQISHIFGDIQVDIDHFLDQGSHGKVRQGPIQGHYIGNPKLGTMLELLKVTDYVGQCLEDVNLSFIMLHGDVDMVRNPYNMY